MGDENTVTLSDLKKWENTAVQPLASKMEAKSNC